MLCLFVVLCGAAFAQQVTAREADPAATKSADNVLNHGTLAFYLGTFDADAEPRFVGLRNDFVLGIGYLTELPGLANLGLDFELFSVNRDFDTPVAPPFLGTLDNDTHLETGALLVGLRLFYPADTALRLYAVGGFGYFTSTMSTTGTLYGLSGVYVDDDDSFDSYYGAGMVYRFGRWRLALDYRRFDLRGDFHDFELVNVDIGGDVLTLSLGYQF